MRPIVAVLIMAGSLSLVADPTAGFDGKWKIDKNASQCDPMLDDLVIELKRSDDGYKVQSRWREPRNGIAPILLLGIMTSEYEFTTDGGENRNFVGPYEQVSKTTVEGNRMTTEWVAQMKDSPTVINGHWVRTLSEDGRTMTLEIKTSRSDGVNREARLVFQRK